MRYRLRTLLIVLALGPPLLAGCTGPINYQPPPVQVRPTLIGTWTTEEVDPPVTLMFSANSDLQVCDDAGRTIRTFTYRQTSDRGIELRINDSDFKLAGVSMIVEPGGDNVHLVLSLPKVNAAQGQQHAKSDRAFANSRLVLKRVK